MNKVTSILQLTAMTCMRLLSGQSAISLIILHFKSSWLLMGSGELSPIRFSRLRVTSFPVENSFTMKLIWQGFSEHFLRCLGKFLFILERCQIAIARVLSLTVIKHFDIFKNCLVSLFPGLKILMMNEFCFQRVKEALGHCIIPAISFAAHATEEFIVV